MSAVWPNGSLDVPPVTEEFGWRTWTTPERMHWGIDLVGFDYVRSPVAGVVIFAGYNGGAGNEVRIRAADGSGDVFRLLHHRALWVVTGQTIDQGTVVGLMGSTGDSTGPHSHFETIPGGNVAVNPRHYMVIANAPAPTPTEENDMNNTVIMWPRSSDGATIYALLNPEARLVSQWTGTDAAYNNRFAAGFRTGSFLPVTESHAHALIASIGAPEKAQVEIVEATGAIVK